MVAFLKPLKINLEMPVETAIVLSKSGGDQFRDDSYFIGVIRKEC